MDVNIKHIKEHCQTVGDLQKLSLQVGEVKDICFNLVYPIGRDLINQEMTAEELIKEVLGETSYIFYIDERRK